MGPDGFHSTGHARGFASLFMSHLLFQLNTFLSWASSYIFQTPESILINVV